MNWFEDDRGNWWNLDQAKGIYPPPTLDSEGNGEIEFLDNDSRAITPAEWPRLVAQLRNGQRPSDRRPLAPAVELQTDPGAPALAQVETKGQARIPQNLPFDPIADLIRKD